MARRGFFGIGVFHIKHEQNAGSLFRSAYAFGASFVFTVGRRYSIQSSDTVKTPYQIPVYHYQTVEELVKGLPLGCRLIAVETRTEHSRSLDTFVHPQTACYLLGAEDHGLTPYALSLCHDVVEIPYASHCLNVATAGTVVCYDRQVKQARWNRPGLNIKAS